MSIIQKKQDEIDALLLDIKKVQDEINAILEKAKPISEKVAEIGNNISKAAPAVGNMIKFVLKQTKFKKSANFYGDLTEKSLEMGSIVVNKFGEWYAERKKRKANEKMLPKKKELASAKIDSLKRLLPKIDNDIVKIEYYCQKEVAQLLVDYDVQRLNIITKGAKELFESFFILYNCQKVSNFLLDEFNAWLNDKHESETELPDTSVVYLSTVNYLVKWSIIPSSNEGLKIINNLSIGSSLLLNDNEINQYAQNFEEVNKLGKWLVNNKTKTLLLPFTNNSKRFKSIFDIFASSIIIKNTKNAIIKKRLILLSLLAVIGIICYLIFK